jgi:hypothetical protein
MLQRMMMPMYCSVLGLRPLVSWQPMNSLLPGLRLKASGLLKAQGLGRNTGSERGSDIITQHAARRDQHPQSRQRACKRMSAACGRQVPGSEGEPLLFNL